MFSKLIGKYAAPVIGALLIALAASAFLIKKQFDWLYDCQTQKAELSAKIELQNQSIEAFRMEASLMGDSLKKHKAEAVKLREAAKKRIKEIKAAPIEKTCAKALGAEVRRIR